MGIFRVDNINVAILTKLNELAERYGVRPYDFVASVYDSSDPRVPQDQAGLIFDAYPSRDRAKEERLDRMLDDLGAPDGNLIGTDEQIIDALDCALSKAPRKRSRP
jgi:hypothetical protein